MKHRSSEPSTFNHRLKLAEECNAGVKPQELLQLGRFANEETPYQKDLIFGPEQRRELAEIRQQLTTLRGELGLGASKPQAEETQPENPAEKPGVAQVEGCERDEDDCVMLGSLEELAQKALAQHPEQASVILAGLKQCQKGSKTSWLRSVLRWCSG